MNTSWICRSEKEHDRQKDGYFTGLLCIIKFAEKADVYPTFEIEVKEPRATQAFQNCSFIFSPFFRVWPSVKMVIITFRKKIKKFLLFRCRS